MFAAAIQRSIENPRTPISNPDEWFTDAMTGGPNYSGQRVNTSTALSYAPLWRGLNLITRDFGKTSLQLFRTSGDKKTLARDDPRYYMLRYKPCEDYDAFRWLITMLWRAILRGNSFAYIYRDNGVDPSEMVPLDPDRTYVIRDNGQIWYVTGVGNDLRKILPDDCIHFRGFGDGFVGVSLLDKARESIGLGLGQQRHASVFYKNAMKPSIVLEYPHKLSEPDFEKLKKQYADCYTGIANMEKALILQNGMQAKPWQVSGRDAQFLESRKHELTVVANWLGLPPHKLGAETKQTKGLEQEQQNYLDEAVDPWYVMAESELREKLLTPKEKKAEKLIIRFNRRELIRVDAATSANIDRIALAGTPWEIVDEVRARRDMDPLPNGEGAIYRPPLNVNNKGVGNPAMGIVKTPGLDNNLKTGQTAGQGDVAIEENSARKLAESMEKIIGDTLLRMHKRAKSRTEKADDPLISEAIRTAIAPWCVLKSVDLDGATIRAKRFLWENEPDLAEFLAEIAGKREN